MMSPTPSAEFIALTDRYLAGELDAPALRRWAALLASDPVAARYYAELAVTEAMLPEALGAALADVPSAGRAPSRRLVFRRVVPALGWAAALVLMVGLAYRVRSPGTAEPAVPVAAAAPSVRLVNALNARWNHTPVSAGALMPGAESSLVSGYAELLMPSGASLRIKAPARITFTGPNAVRLSSGTLAATVPARATGFTVESPHARIVDVSTRFGVAVSPVGDATTVGVLQGEVALTHRSGTVRLRAGEAMCCTAETGLSEPLHTGVFPEKFPDREFAWKPVSDAPCRFDLSSLVAGPGDYRLLLKWLRGDHAIKVKSVELRRDGVPVATHAGDVVTGYARVTHGNLITLTVPAGAPSGGRWELVLTPDYGVASEGVVAFERMPDRAPVAADIVGRWVFADGSRRMVREFLPDGGCRLYRDGISGTSPEAARYRVENGVIYVESNRMASAEAYILRDDGALVCVNYNYPNARRESNSGG